MNCPHAATLSDLAGRDELVGRRVRFLAEDVPFVPRGSVGEVVDFRTCEPKATVRYVVAHRGEQEVESRFRWLELVDEES